MGLREIGGAQIGESHIRRVQSRSGKRGILQVGAEEESSKELPAFEHRAFQRGIDEVGSAEIDAQRNPYESCWCRWPRQGLSDFSRDRIGQPQRRSYGPPALEIFTDFHLVIRE